VLAQVRQAIAPSWAERLSSAAAAARWNRCTTSNQHCGRRRVERLFGGILTPLRLLAVGIHAFHCSDLIFQTLRTYPVGKLGVRASTQIVFELCQYPRSSRI